MAAVCLSGVWGAEPNGTYVPDPEIERLLEQVTKADRLTAQNAFTRLSGFGGAAERALQWHMHREADAPGRTRWAEVLARLGRGKTAYRVTLELQADGSGLLTLWSDRALLGQCGKGYDRLLGKPERQIDDDELRRNVYGKGELFEFLNDGVKHLEARAAPRGQAIEAQGLLSFKSFDALAAFADKFDRAGYYMLCGATLSDSANAVRAYRFRKVRETNREQYEKNLLLFHDVQWEFVLDFKGRIAASNAVKTDGSKLVWTFNCYQMVSGQALVEASFDAAGLPPRMPKEDRALPLPDVIQANQPMAMVRHSQIRAKVYRKTSDPMPTPKVLRERNQLIELDGRESLPHGANLQYRWTQTFGADLKLSPADLAQPRVCLVINETGEYRFELVVANGLLFSKPVEVKVIIEEDAGAVQLQPPAPVAAEREAKPAPPPEPPAAPAAPAKMPPKAAAAGTPPAPEPGKAHELYTEGLKRLKAFEFAEAKKALAAALDLDSDNRECQFSLALALLECSEIPAALTKFEDLAAGTRDARATMYVGHCHARAGNTVEAGRWYRKGVEIGKQRVAWEPRWQLGNTALRNNDPQYALQCLTDAEQTAAKADITDYRLCYDLARALRGCRKNAEALEKLKALQELGYTPDPRFVAEVEKGTESDGASSVAEKTPEPKLTEQPKVTETAKPPTPDTKPVVAEKKPEPKPTEQPKVAETAKPPPPDTKPVVAEKKPEPKPTEQPKVVDTAKPPAPDTAAPNANSKSPIPNPRSEVDASAAADVVDLTKLTATRKPPPAPQSGAAPAGAPAPKTGGAPANVAPGEPAQAAPAASQREPLKTQPARKTETVGREEPKKTPAEPAKPVDQPKPAPKKAGPKTEPKPATPKRSLPPVPEDLDKALAAGRRACAEAARLLALGTPEAKAQAARACDESEAMLQGAWAKKQGDADVMAAFRELSKHVKVIAIARNPVIKAKVRGLVALDAELSIVPQGKPLYCVWEQVGGESLNLRPEDMSQKKVGLRIPRPGVYTFELAVSDGSLGGNPVSVTVEVVE